ncbi:adenylate/guanylate cyclase domain-containing protein [Clostridium aestuarii]|uniref:Adenylate/guanylate cyclase domain-containing protein n=1 Tax=Clostridium aestuarii TaxID=338193 RepID=A0ABT4CYV8_9CLOT|nr:adenylate/guanylate cyclase domain-containing protein [Clostridium aestuarii]MCY6484174.1 adenylate/guanylate cyclase domain-containing protein [Clostridium aestuarii]
MRTKNIYFSMFITLVVVIISFIGLFDSVENNGRDSLFQYKKKNVDLQNIVIVGIDDKSLNNIGRWPWDRNVHAKLIQKLKEGEAAVVGVDVILAESSKKESDDALVNIVKSVGNVVFPVVGNFNYKKLSAQFKMGKIIGDVNPESIIESFEQLKKISVAGHINVFEDPKDGIVRSALESFKFNNKEIKSFDYVIVKEYEKRTGKKILNGEIPKDFFNRYYIDFNGVPGAFNHVSYYDVLSGKVPPIYFKDKIVLIGPYAEGFPNDSFYTSIQKNARMYGVEVHANIIQNILHNNFKQEVSELIKILITIFLGIASYFIFNKITPKLSFILLLLLSAIYLIISRFVYSNGYILNVAYPLILLALLYIFSIAYKYLNEFAERRRVTNIFGKYVAPQVVDEILKGELKEMQLGGEKREISVLFVDIRGFTPLSEKVQPEQVVEILNEYLTLTSESIFKFRGTLDKFIGDATMAIFNAPLDLEEHPLKAVQAAFEMKKGSEKLRKKLQDKFGISVEFGIGINTGYAVVGNIGSSTRMDYTAIGDTVNTSARLESSAKRGQILLSASTYERVKDKIKANYLGEIKVKGKETMISIYELEDINVD